MKARIRAWCAPCRRKRPKAKRLAAKKARLAAKRARLAAKRAQLAADKAAAKAAAKATRDALPRESRKSRDKRWREKSAARLVEYNAARAAIKADFGPEAELPPEVEAAFDAGWAADREAIIGPMLRRLRRDKR